MAIVVACGDCGKKYQVGPDRAGKRIRCQACGGTVLVPAEEPVATSPPTAPSSAAPAKIAVQCGSCRKQFQLGPHLAGKKVKCNQCGAAIDVPAQPAARPPAGAKTAAKPAAASGSKANPPPQKPSVKPAARQPLPPAKPAATPPRQSQSAPVGRQAANLPPQSGLVPLQGTPANNLSDLLQPIDDEPVAAGPLDLFNSPLGPPGAAPGPAFNPLNPYSAPLAPPGWGQQPAPRRSRSAQAPPLHVFVAILALAWGAFALYLAGRDCYGLIQLVRFITAFGGSIGDIGWQFWYTMLIRLGGLAAAAGICAVGVGIFTRQEWTEKVANVSCGTYLSLAVLWFLPGFASVASMTSGTETSIRINAEAIGMSLLVHFLIHAVAPGLILAWSTMAKKDF